MNYVKIKEKGKRQKKKIVTKLEANLSNLSTDLEMPGNRYKKNDHADRQIRQTERKTKKVTK
jgi:hypothetical protein